MDWEYFGGYERRGLAYWQLASFRLRGGKIGETDGSCREKGGIFLVEKVFLKRKVLVLPVEKVFSKWKALILPVEKEFLKWKVDFLLVEKAPAKSFQPISTNKIRRNQKKTQSI